MEHFSTNGEVHDEEEPRACLERVVQSDHVGMLHGLENGMLGPQVHKLVAVNNCALLEDLHGKETIVINPANEKNLAERPTADGGH